MGAYVDPLDKTKEEWLTENATEIQLPWSEIPDDSLPIVLIRNPGFSAAGIGFNEMEYQAFQRSGDPRPKRFFIAKIKDLLTVSLELKGYLSPDHIQRRA